MYNMICCDAKDNSFVSILVLHSLLKKEKNIQNQS